jgi:hypothetical protein
MPHVVARFRLDLDDVGAKQGELIRAEWPGDVAGKVENADAGKGFGHGYPGELENMRAPFATRSLRMTDFLYAIY